MKDTFLANIATRVSRLCETQMYTTERMTVRNLLSAVFVKSANLWTHMRIYHTNGCFPCRDCKKEFKTKWDLKSHQAEACILKPFPCDRCGKGYERIEHLQRHKATHTAY